MRELRVEDALLYLDQVKMEFGDRPQIYNEFLDIMKTFKTQQIDTPGVIRRVSTLFQGNKRLVLGFNTFLPEGYKIELPLGDGPPVAVYRAPGQPGVTHILGPSTSAEAPPVQQPVPAQAQRPQMAQKPPPQAQQHPGGAPLPQQIQQRPSPFGQTKATPNQQQEFAVERQARAPQPQPQAPPPQKPPAHEMPGQHPPQAAPQAALSGPGQQQQGQPGQPPVEFDHAINYVTTIKRRFSGAPDTYKKFLEILHTYQKEQRGIKEVLDEVSLLFADHPDLLKQFTYFLPDAVQAQAKAQLDQVAKEAEARNRAAASKKAIMQQAKGMQQQSQVLSAPPPPRRQTNHQLPPQQPPQQLQPPQQQQQQPPQQQPHAPIPFGATQGRSDDREREIARSVIYGTVSFAPVRPPRKNELTPTQAASKKGRPQMIPELPVQPTTAESAFFERAKLHLSRKELAPDKPPGSRRHTPYVEFLKCLHLFGAGILNKDELLLLLRGLFMQGHAPKSGINAGGGASNPAVANDAQELLREFEEVLVSRGHYANQEEASKTKSKYGDKQIRDMDLSGCERLTPSYRTYPPDYPMNKFFFHSGQSGMDATVLNSDTLCVPEKKNRIWSPEEYDGPTKRHNPYEEAMLLAEDERFEVDMAIQRNIMAMRQVEPIAEEVTQLRENEEKDGQPIGRMHYKLRSRQLNNAQINAIARLYGDSGDEVLQHLVRNPVAVLPIVFNRLKQKDIEWREAKKELNKKWEAIYDANHEGSLDATCWFHKRDLERSFDEKKLVKQAKNCQDFVKEPSVLASRAATKDYHPQFLRGSTDSDSLLYQPHMKLPMSPEMPHQDAYHLIKTTLMKLGTKVDHEPVFRVWTEFMASFFSFPSDFVIDDAREGNCKKQALALKYNTGQKVMTSFGQGEILSVSEGTGQSTLRYKVRLPFGIGFVRPESIFQSANAPGFLARNGDQVKVSETEFPGSDYRLDNKYKLVFVEEIVYKFLRIYSLLVSILHDTKSRLLQTDSDQMDTTVDNKTFGPAYTAYLSKLKEVMVSQPDLLAFERFCRATCKKRVGQLTVLPKIVDSCARLLVEISKDDVLLSAYDFSMWGERDPVKLRSQCLSVSDESSYRVQISDDNIFFAYVDPDQDLMALPEDDEEEDEMDDDAEDGEIEESGEDLNPDDDGQPDSKRQKLK